MPKLKPMVSGEEIIVSIDENNILLNLIIKVKEACAARGLRLQNIMRKHSLIRYSN